MKKGMYVLRKCVTLGLVMAMTVALCSCGSNDETSGAQTSDNESTAGSGSNDTENDETGNAVTDGTYGKVTAVDGDTLTVAVMEMDMSAMPSMDPNSTMNPDNKPNGDKPSGDRPDGDKPTGDKPDEASGSGDSGNKPAGNPPNGADGRGGFVDNMVETGDTAQITIDDSVEVTDMKGETVTADSIAVDTMLSITYEDDGSTVQKITVFNAGSQD